MVLASEGGYEVTEEDAYTEKYVHDTNAENGNEDSGEEREDYVWEGVYGV